MPATLARTISFCPSAAYKAPGFVMLPMVGPAGKMRTIEAEYPLLLAGETKMARYAGSVAELANTLIARRKTRSERA